MNIEPPDWLPEEAKVIFHHTVKLLGKSAIELDASIIADFAKCQVEVIELEKECAFEGTTIMGRTGQPYINPRYQVLMGRRKDLMQLRNDLKLTPRARNSAIKTTSAGALKTAMAPS